VSDATWYVSPEQYRGLREWLAVNASAPDRVQAWPMAAAMICGYSAKWPGPTGNITIVVVYDETDLLLCRSPHVDEAVRNRAIARATEVKP
jgi:hypothetical protein